jgi:hypothetical protein
MKKIILLAIAASPLFFIHNIHTVVVGRYGPITYPEKIFKNETDGQLKIRIEYNTRDLCAPEEFLVEKGTQRNHPIFYCWSHVYKIIITATSGKAYTKKSLELIYPDRGWIISNKEDGSLLATVMTTPIPAKSYD